VVLLLRLSLSHVSPCVTVFVDHLYSLCSCVPVVFLLLLVSISFPVGVAQCWWSWLWTWYSRLQYFKRDSWFLYQVHQSWYRGCSGGPYYYQCARLYCSGMIGSLILDYDAACSQVWDYALGPADRTWCLVRNRQHYGEVTTVFSCAGNGVTTTSTNGQPEKTAVSLALTFILSFFLLFATQQWW